MQGSFSRLKMPLDANDTVKRGRLLDIVARLHNVRTIRVGRNEIATTYSETWQADQMQRELWDNFDGMVFGEIRRRDRVSRFHVVPIDE